MMIRKTTLKRLSSMTSKVPRSCFRPEQEQEDKFNVKFSSYSVDRILQGKRIDSNETNINLISIVFNHPITSSLSNAKTSRLLKPNIQLSFIMLAIVCLILITVMPGLYIHASTRLGQLKTNVKTRGKLFVEIQLMNNHTMKASKALDDRIKDLIF